MIEVVNQGTSAEIDVGSHRAPPSPKPSVAASTLHMYANQNKLKPGRYGNEPGDDYEEEEDDEEEDGGGDADSYAAEEDAADGGGYEEVAYEPTPRPSQRKRRPADQQHYTPAETRERIRLIARIRRRQGGDGKLETATLSMLRVMSAGAGYEVRAKTAVQMMRRFTMFAARVIETICARYPKLAGDLSGWSESVYMQLDSYDEMLYDIYDEYGDQLQGNPIVMYLMALGSNAVMFAMAKKVINHPATGAVLSDLAAAFRQNVSAAPPAAAAAPRQAPPLQAPPPAVPISDSVAGLGNLDLNSLFAGISSMLGGGNKENVRPADTDSDDGDDDGGDDGGDGGNDDQKGVLSLKSLLRKSEDIMEADKHSGGLSRIAEDDDEDDAAE